MMRMKRRRHKGDFGYLESERKNVLIRTIILFAVPIIIFLTGYFYHNRDSKNIITVVAVLGCLPACKSMVNLIMFFRAKGCSKQAKDKIVQAAGGENGCFDLYFTSYERNYAISHLYLADAVLCGFTESPKCKCREGEEHLTAMLKGDGHKGIAVKIFDTLPAYLEALSNLKKKEMDSSMSAEKEAEIYSLLKSISL